MNNNSKPNAGEYWYRDHPLRACTIAYVFESDGALYWKVPHGMSSRFPVRDDGKWISRVPMPGEDAQLRKLFYELWRELAGTYPESGSRAAGLLGRCRQWDDANPKPEETP